MLSDNILKTPSNTKISLLILIAFVLCFIYWTYLALVSQMIIINDAITYHDLGFLISKSGWTDYLKTGPNREPLYPFIISISVSLGHAFSVPYDSVQKFLQICILFVTQILMLIILKKLKIHDLIVAATILYFGFSPSMINSALSLFSEIATYPLVLSLIFLACKAFEVIQRKHKSRISPINPKVIFLAELLGLVFILITFVKGIFEYIMIIFIIPFIMLAAKAHSKKDRGIFIHSVIFIVISLLIFQVTILGYKAANKKYNGNFVLTDRGSFALYGNTARRMEKLTTERFLTALAYVPGPEFCKTLFSEKDCSFWAAGYSDILGHENHAALINQHLTHEQADKKQIHLSLEKIIRNPFQYILLMGLESLKMLFWESTKIGHVMYPDWLVKIYNGGFFEPALATITSLLALLAMIYLTKTVWHERKNIFSLNAPPDESKAILFFSLILIIAFNGLHSLFLVLPRYIFPIAPLYLIAIAFMMQKLFFKK